MDEARRTLGLCFGYLLIINIIAWDKLWIIHNEIINDLIACIHYTVKPVLSGRSKERKKTKILMTQGSLMKVESIAECDFWPALSDTLF